MAENEVIQDDPILEEQDTEEVSSELEEKVEVGGGETGTSSVPDPVVKGSTKRGADKTDGETATPSMTKSQMLSGVVAAMNGMNKTDMSNVYASVVSKAPARKADKAGAGDPMPKIKMAEDVQEMFAGEELSEEFIDQATTIFEAAVNARYVAEAARLEEQYEAKLEESKQQFEEELAQKVDDYLNYVVTEWVEDNKLAIDSSLKTEVTESFIHGLKGLFESHYIDVPEEKLDILGELSAKTEELESKLNEEMEKNIELLGQLNGATRREVFEKVSEGLVKTQVEKFRSLAEGIDFESAETFETKLKVIRDNYFESASEAQPAVLEEEVIVAEDTSDEQSTHVDPAMQKYVSAISRTLKK